MTLSTEVAVTITASARAVLAAAVDALIWADGREMPAEIHYVEGEPYYKPNGRRRIGTRIGQGLPAITDLTYAPDGPLAMDWMSASEFYGEDDVESDYDRIPACTHLIDWDTAYGYRSAHREIGCAELHLLAILKLAQWVRANGGEEVWFCNEYDGLWAWSQDLHAINRMICDGAGTIHGPDRVKRFARVAGELGVLPILPVGASS